MITLITCVVLPAARKSIWVIESVVASGTEHETCAAVQNTILGDGKFLWLFLTFTCAGSVLPPGSQNIEHHSLASRRGGSKTHSNSCSASL